MLIEILKTILIGFVEGITEWLPVSSTGHMILLEEFVHLKMTEEFMARFEMVLETVRFEEYDKLSYDFLYGYEERILNFNSFDMLVKAIRSGLLLKIKKEIYIDYCLTKEQTELVPYLMSNTLWRW